MSDEIEDARDVLALSDAENAELCTGCTRCCEGVSIEVDAPRSSWEYDQWIWVLHHRGLEIYVEAPERWYLHVPARCDQLRDDGRCTIYGRHPRLCREYDPRDCERRAPLSDVRAWFHDAAEFETWLERTRPEHWRRLLAWRDERREAAAAPVLLQVAEPTGHAVAATVAAAAARRSRSNA